MFTVSNFFYRDCKLKGEMEISKHFLGHLELGYKERMCTHALTHTHTYAHVCNRPGGEGRRAAFPEWEMRTYIDQKMESSTEARERCERGI